MHDLLGSDGETLPIKENAADKVFFVKDLTDKVVENQNDVEDLINEVGSRGRCLPKWLPDRLSEGQSRQLCDSGKSLTSWVLWTTGWYVLWCRYYRCIQ